MNKQFVLPADIHLPPEPSLWPLAIGWWLLLALSLLVVVLVWYNIQKKQKNMSLVIPQSLQQLAWLSQQKKMSDSQLIRHLSSLLRRTAISIYGRNKVAGLAGQNWLKFLDKTSNQTAFTQGIGRIFIDQPYKKSSHYNRDDLLKLVKHWIASQEKKSV